MARQEFEMIVASAAKKKLISFSATNVIAIPAGNIEYTRFYAPANTIVKVLGIYCSYTPPPGATSGSHLLAIGFENMNMIVGSSLFGANLSFDAGMFTSANQLKNPDTTEAMATVLNNIHFDALTPIKFEYRNNTNVAQATARDIRMWGIAETVG